MVPTDPMFQEIAPRHAALYVDIDRDAHIERICRLEKQIADLLAENNEMTWVNVGLRRQLYDYQTKFGPIDDAAERRMERDEALLRAIAPRRP